MKPTDGGTAIDVEGGEGVAVVTQSVREVFHAIMSAQSEYGLDPNPEKLWVEFEAIADPDEDWERRPFWVHAGRIVCLTYVSPETLERWETEIS